MRANPKTFMLRVHGNAMNRALPDGFLALIAPDGEFEATDRLYAVSADGAPYAVRRAILHDNGLSLVPESHDPTYRPRLVDLADPAAPSVRTIGRVVWYYPPADWSIIDNSAIQNHVLDKASTS